MERVKGNGYRARGNEPFAVSTRGATREEALTMLRAKIQTRLKKGTEIVGLEMSEQPHPLAEFAGMFKDDPSSRIGRKPSPNIAGRWTTTRITYEPLPL